MAKTAEQNAYGRRRRAGRTRRALTIALCFASIGELPIQAADQFLRSPAGSPTSSPPGSKNPSTTAGRPAPASAGLGNLVGGERRSPNVRETNSPPVQQIPNSPPAAARNSNRVNQAGGQANPATIFPPPPEPQVNGPKSIEVSVPLENGEGTGKIDLSLNDDRISLVVRDAPINVVLGVLAQQHGLNVVTGDNVNGVISVTLTDVSLDAGLNAILRTNGYTWTRQDNIIVVTRIGPGNLASPQTQGRELRVFTLNFLAAADVDMVVKGLLSPVGKSIVTESDPMDKRRTREQLVVEDLPEYIHRIQDYLSQADQAPRQVMIEAHILQVSLKDETKHGVDIQRLLARVDNTDLTFRSAGLASPTASPAYFLGIDGTDLDVLVELIKQTTDTKTLASPKVMVVNGQEAHMQTGARLGYNTTTTTQTSTMQQVQFLDVGVILRVTPTITADNQILMKVRPEVSDGNINATTQLPESKTTEVETTVMLNDGRGMVIGGLIKEEDTETQAKLPIMGDLWLIGRLFQRRVYSRSRNEIIVVLVPRLVPMGCPASEKEDIEILRATSPVVGPHLERVDRRPVEPELPDAVRNPRVLAPKRIPDFFRSLHRPYPNPKKYYYPSADGDVNLQGLHPRDPGILNGPQPGGEYGMAPGEVYCPPDALPPAPN